MASKKYATTIYNIVISGPLINFFPQKDEFYICKIDKHTTKTYSIIEKNQVIVFNNAHVEKDLHWAYRIIYKFYVVSTNQYVESVMSEHFINGEMTLEQLTKFSKISFENFNMFFSKIT